MGELGGKSSPYSESLHDEVASPSLTSFPDPSTASVRSLEVSSQSRKSQQEQLSSLLEGNEHSLFDEQHRIDINDPQALSAAPLEVVQGVISHHGAVELVQRLSSLLAERDAHITALTRLAEEYNAPQQRIIDTASRVKQAEQRRISLAEAFEDNVASRSALPLMSPTFVPGRAESIRSNDSGTIRGLTKLFGGTGKAHSRPLSISSARPSKPPSIASRSESQKPKPRERPGSIDVISNESNSWTTSLFTIGSGSKKTESKPPVEMNTRHDPDQLPPTLVRQETENPHEIEWNRFIVRLAELRQQHNEITESNTLIGAANFGLEGAVGRQKLEKLTRLVVGGIPMHLRHPLWMELSNTNSMMTPDAYSHYLSQQEGADTSQIDAILKDIPRTLTDSYDFYANKGYERLRRVLEAFVGKYFELGYTQGLNYIAGYLLLAIPAEEEAFWVLCNMVDNFIPPNYFAPSTSMCGALADNIVLRQYIKELLPQLARHLDSLDISADHTVNPGWWLTALANMLPPTMLLRVWDVMLCLPNQQTYIFNVVLTLLSHNQDRLLQCETDSEYWSFQYDIPNQPMLLDRFLKQAFMLGKKLEKIGELRQTEVQKLIEGRLQGYQESQRIFNSSRSNSSDTQSIRKTASTEALYPDDERTP